MDALWPGNFFARFLARAAVGTIADVLKHTNDRLFAEGDTDTEVMQYYNEYHPAYMDWFGKYGQIPAKDGQQKTATGIIENRLAALTPKVNSWDIAIQAAGFIKGSPEYDGYFPHGHAAFTNGKREDRINALRGLSDAMTGKPALSAKKAEVDAEINALDSADTVQDNRISDRKQLGEVIKEDNAIMAKTLQGVLGGLMHRYRNTPEEVPTFFRLDLILKKQQRDFTGTLDGDEIHFIVQRTLDANEDLDLTNDGDSPIIYYFADTITAAPSGDLSQQVDPGHYMTVLASALGASATNKYLMVKNKTAVEGHFRVVI